MSNQARYESESRIPNYDHLFGDSPSARKTDSHILYDIFRQFWGRFIVSTIAYLIKHSPTWVIPVITAEIINIAAEEPSASNFRTLAIYTAVIVVLLLQNVPTHTWYAHNMNIMLRSFSAGLRSALVKKLQRLSISYHKQMESGKLQSKFIRDIDAVNGLMSQILQAIVPAVLGVIISTGIAFYRSPLMTLFFVLVIPTNILVVKFFSRKITQQSHDFRIANEDVSSSFTSMLRMIPVTRAHGLEQKEENRFDTGLRHLTFTGLIFDRTQNYFGAWMWVISNLLANSCLIVCAVLAMYGKIGVGDIVLYQSLFSQINGNVSTLVNIIPSIITGLESLTSLSEVMTSDDIEHDGKHHLKGIQGKVDFNHVDYAYPDSPDVNVITDFDLHVKPGECIAFVGSSGSGKTTLVNMVIGFLRATKGTVTIDDEDINKVRIRNYRHHISVVPQNAILFPGTIRENITYGLDKYTEEELQQVVEMANISEFLPELPKGLDTFVGEEGDKLSGGQRQRITIARALIREPAILILDEATSALDNVSEYHVQKAIEKTVEGRTTFIVAHRLSTIRNADRIVVMEHGRCIECGTYAELMAAKGKFYQLKSLSDMATKEIEADRLVMD